MQSALRDGEPRIFHLHGVYDEPDSVVFGIADYAALVEDPAYRIVFSSLWLTKTLLFIGCSFDGLSDPDFSRMLEWASSTFKGSPCRHYALLLNGSFTAEDTRDISARLANSDCSLRTDPRRASCDAARRQSAVGTRDCRSCCARLGNLVWCSQARRQQSVCTYAGRHGRRTIPGGDRFSGRSPRAFPAANQRCRSLARRSCQHATVDGRHHRSCKGQAPSP